ncbi:MAG: DUF427 domain-containing protein [Rhodothermales bacterium]|nr:DUF427 domain-containing protein [Rhodothermales bacterium]
MKAIWKNTVVAESDATIVIEGNHYFPPDAIHSEYFRLNPMKTFCPWKGSASYYNLVVEGQTNEAAAWYYPAPKDAAAEITDYVAFWKGVEVIG